MSEYVFCNQCGSANEVASRVKAGPELEVVTFKDCAHRQHEEKK